jgi:hypothetical protein
MVAWSGMEFLLVWNWGYCAPPKWHISQLVKLWALLNWHTLVMTVCRNWCCHPTGCRHCCYITTQAAHSWIGDMNISRHCHCHYIISQAAHSQIADLSRSVHFLSIWTFLVLWIMLHVQFLLYWYIDRQINRCYYCQKDKLCYQNLVMSMYVSMDSFVLFILTEVLSKDGICDHLWDHNITASFTSIMFPHSAWCILTVVSKSYISCGVAEKTQQQHQHTWT